MPRAILDCSAALLLSVLLPAARPAFAQSAAMPQEVGAASVAYNTASEILLRGTISQVVTRPAPGLPLGLHLMVSTAQSTVDAHLGPYLTAIADQKGLVPGASIQMLGVMSHLAAGDVFLVRTLTVSGKTIVVRSTSGIPLRQFAPNAPPARSGSEHTGGL